MHAEFWYECWRKNKIGFHQRSINANLRTYFEAIRNGQAGQVLVPLCGKSKDMLWIDQQGHSVLGVELCPLAVTSFFRENGLTPTIQDDVAFVKHQHRSIEILLGDFFDLTPQHTQKVTAVYDRTALIAMRPDYATKMSEIVPPDAKILLIGVTYPPERTGGPPFSVPEAEIRAGFSSNFEVEVLERHELPWHLDDGTATTKTETIYRLTRRRL